MATSALTPRSTKEARQLADKLNNLWPSESAFLEPIMGHESHSHWYNSTAKLFLALGTLFLAAELTRMRGLQAASRKRHLLKWCPLIFSKDRASDPLLRMAIGLCWYLLYFFFFECKPLGDRQKILDLFLCKPLCEFLC